MKLKENFIYSKFYFKELWYARGLFIYYNNCLYNHIGKYGNCILLKIQILGVKNEFGL